MTKQVENQLKWYSLKIQTLVTRVGKNISISRMKRFLSKCVILYGFQKTSKKKSIHFTRNNSWSQKIFKLERTRKKYFRIYIFLSMFCYTEKVVHSRFIVKWIIIQLSYSCFSILTRFAPGNEKYNYIIPYTYKANLFTCSNGASFKMMIIRGLVFFVSRYTCSYSLRTYWLLSTFRHRLRVIKNGS